MFIIDAFESGITDATLLLYAVGLKNLNVFADIFCNFRSQSSDITQGALAKPTENEHSESNIYFTSGKRRMKKWQAATPVRRQGMINGEDMTVSNQTDTVAKMLAAFPLNAAKDKHWCKLQPLYYCKYIVGLVLFLFIENNSKDKQLFESTIHFICFC